LKHLLNRIVLPAPATKQQTGIKLEKLLAGADRIVTVK